MRTPRRLHRSQRGAALVEFAVILPVLIILLFGVWEMGRIFDAWLVVTNAAREGARYAAEIPDDSVVRDRVQHYIKEGYAGRLGLAGDIDPTAVNIDIDRPSNSGPVTVTVDVEVDVYAPLEGIPLLRYPFTVHGFAVMRQ